MSIYSHGIRETGFDKKRKNSYTSLIENCLTEQEDIPEIDFMTLVKLKEACIDLNCDTIDSLNEAFLDPPESVKLAKEKIDSLIDLRNQWKKVADKFVMRKWIYRYVKDEAEEAKIRKYYDALRDENTSYNEYKKAFKAICNFFSLSNNDLIIENLQFDYDKKDKKQKKCALRYSRGMARVNIPDNIDLIHVSPANNIKELIPSFRSKLKGRFMYPSKRCFFTVAHKINPYHAGLEGKKTSKYRPKQHYKVAYIDPTYAMFKDGSVYIETDRPIPVEKVQ